MISPRQALLRKPRRRFYGDGVLGGLLLLLVIVPALLAPWLPLPDPLINDLAAAFSPPGSSGAAGTVGAKVSEASQDSRSASAIWALSG